MNRLELIDKTLDQIQEDIEVTDWTALEELLAKVPDSELERYLNIHRP